MKKGFNQMIAIVMIAVSSVAFTGCYGSFSLTSKNTNSFTNLALDTRPFQLCNLEVKEKEP